MRRNWLTVFIFVLALAVQAMAPAAVNAAVAKGASATGPWIELCLSGADGGSQKQAPGHSHRDSCPLCQISCDGFAPPALRHIVLDEAPVPTARFAWIVADRVLPVPDPDFARQARAPPAIS